MPVAVVGGAGAAGKPFHFGETLAEVCRDANLERVVYVGGGSMPLRRRGTYGTWRWRSAGLASALSPTVFIRPT